MRATGDGLVFLGPEGQTLQVCPPLPAVRGRAERRLAERHEQQGLAIGPKTAVTTWGGEPMDYNLALGLVAQRRRRG
ncbi:MAG: hypothetical protein ACQEXJ_18580 [Myxococcota bacterium]